MSPQMSWADEIANCEDRLLRFGRRRFLLRAAMFGTLCVWAIAYRCIPLKGMIVLAVVVLLLLWGLDAYAATRESVAYNEYVRLISPEDAVQRGFKLAPVRGVWSHGLLSWDVAFFYAPFVAMIGLLVVSPNRITEPLQDNDNKHIVESFDERMLGHQCVRHCNIQEFQRERCAMVMRVVDNLKTQLHMFCRP